MRNKLDLTYLENLMRLVIREEVPKIVKAETKHLPTKNEFYKRLDALMKELQDMRDEVAVVSGYRDQIEDHETRLIKVEQHLHIAP